MKRANLCHITFTGIDARTDVRALHEIQREFPIAEFLHLTRTWCNTTSAHCTRPDGHSMTHLTTECGIEPPKTHD